MKIKRYMAVSMRAALALVRAEQGPDAVILSSRRLDEGIEVIAAVDYDEALFAAAIRPRMPLGAAEPEPVTPAPAVARSMAPLVTPAVAPLVTPASASMIAPRVTSAEPPIVAPQVTSAEPPIVAPLVTSAVAPAIARAADSGYLAMQQELKGLRELLQGEFAQMSWNDKRLREPLQTRVLEELTALDIAPDVALALAAITPRHTSLPNPSHIPLALLVRHLPVVDKLSTVDGGVIALVGPTGAGKTTTIAKLAAQWSMLHGSQDLALVSTDAHRIGAREQLMTYARILDAPMHTANGGKELARVLERLKLKKLVLIDTAGMGPRDGRLAEHLAALKLGAAGARILLTLPAQSEAHALEEIVRSFAGAAPVACVLTKVDEAASLGAVLSTTLRHKLRIAYLCDGQRVPADLHPAHERRVWLVNTAVKLKQHAPPRHDGGYYARNFGRVQAHA